MYFFYRLLYSPRIHLCGEKGDGGGRYYSTVWSNSPRCLLTPHFSSFFPPISLVFHSAWLVRWQGEMGWDDRKRGEVVGWWVALSTLYLSPLLSPCPAYLFLDLSTPFVFLFIFFTYSYTVSCPSLVLLFLLLHLSLLSCLPCPERRGAFQRDGIKIKTEGKKKLASDTVFWFGLW